MSFLLGLYAAELRAFVTDPIPTPPRTPLAESRPCRLVSCVSCLRLVSRGILAATNHAAAGNGDNVDKRVQFRPLHARVFQFAKVRLDGERCRSHAETSMTSVNGYPCILSETNRPIQSSMVRRASQKRAGANAAAKQTRIRPATRLDAKQTKCTNRKGCIETFYRPYYSDFFQQGVTINAICCDGRSRDEVYKDCSVLHSKSVLN